MVGPQGTDNIRTRRRGIGDARDPDGLQALLHTLSTTTNGPPVEQRAL